MVFPDSGLRGVLLFWPALMAPIFYLGLIAGICSNHMGLYKSKIGFSLALKANNS